MIPSGTPSNTNPVDVPAPLEEAYKWWKVLGMIATTVAAALSYLVSKDDAKLLAWLSVLFFFILYVAMVFARNNVQASQIVERTFSRSEYIKVEERERALGKLKRSSRHAQIITFFLLGVACVSLALLFYRPIYYKLSTKHPDSVQFESIQYFDPTRDEALFHKSQFLEALVTFLKDEGQSEGRKTRIVFGKTKPFPHPSPALRISVSVTDPEYVVTAYAFRQYRLRERLLYESVPVNYPQRGSILFSLPRCDPGDQLFFVGRLSLADDREPFPIDLQAVLKPYILRG